MGSVGPGVGCVFRPVLVNSTIRAFQVLPGDQLDRGESMLKRAYLEVRLTHILMLLHVQPEI